MRYFYLNVRSKLTAIVEHCTSENHQINEKKN